MKCRHCDHELTHRFVDLDFAPPSNAYLTEQALNQHEKYFPLKVYVCEQCWLVQTDDVTDADELFTDDYAYFSSTSAGWLAHAKQYCELVEQRFNLNSSSFVVELAANDGYLLKNMVEKGIPCLGIEPTKSTADAAKTCGVPITQAFFTQALAQVLVDEGNKADLIIGNNVFAHVPFINDFTQGMATLLKPEGVITLEFPHVLELIKQCQFDTVYHEHFSYLSLTAVTAIFKQADLRIFDVEQLTTHGGSLRVYGCHQTSQHEMSERVTNLHKDEFDFGLCNLKTYTQFQQRVESIKYDLFSFLMEQKQARKTVIAYGAAAKGNTLLNYAGIKPDLLPAVVDAAEAKQGMYLPGSHIPIYSPEYIQELKPDFVIILPWNIAAEVMLQQADIASWGGRFVTVIPELKMY
jgi:2-polyprenyl-3-methyl-5-hydroxy-6-metoxy-1,4-benzoquinol methylase